MKKKRFLTVMMVLMLFFGVLGAHGVSEAKSISRDNKASAKTYTIFVRCSATGNNMKMKIIRSKRKIQLSGYYQKVNRRGIISMDSSKMKKKTFKMKSGLKVAIPSEEGCDYEDALSYNFPTRNGYVNGPMMSITIKGKTIIGIELTA